MKPSRSPSVLHFGDDTLSFDDPFKTAPTNDVFAPKAEETAPVTDNNLVQNVAASSDDFVATLKYGAGYDAPWLVVRDATSEGLKQKLEGAAGSGLMETIAKAAAMAAALAPGKPAAQAAPATTAPPTFQNGQVQYGAAPAPAAGGYTCAHGARNYKNGGSWEAQFCGAPQGTPKDQQCAPLWKDKKTGDFK